MMKLKSVIKKRNKRGQVQIQDGVAVVMLIGLMFITMAVIALTGEKLGEAITSSGASVTNESGVNASDEIALAGASDKGSKNFVVVTVLNETGIGAAGIIPSNNYTVDKVAGTIVFVNGLDSNGTLWNITYTYDYNTASQNVTNDLETEVGNNTSIAGIVLTISLISMILTVLIGVFGGFIRRGKEGV